MPGAVGLAIANESASRCSNSTSGSIVGRVWGEEEEEEEEEEKGVRKYGTDSERDDSGARKSTSKD